MDEVNTATVGNTFNMEQLMSLEVGFRNFLAAGTAKHKHSGFWALPK